MAKSNLSQVAGVLDASNFAYGINPNADAAVVLTGNNSTGAGTSITIRAPQPFQPVNVELSDGTALQPFATTAPITINDANVETVTPTGVSINSDGTITITGNFTHTHGQGALVTSGTVGLQEAINYAATVLTGGVVVVDGAWVALGGTQAILNAAMLPTAGGVAIVDNRGSLTQSYGGSADAITFPAAQNTALITSANSTTLATPAAKDNGKTLLIVNTVADANTVTAASGKIVDGISAGTTYSTVTFAAHPGGSVLLLAANSLWNVISNTNGTLS